MVETSMSTFQALPLHVADRVVEYVGCASYYKYYFISVAVKISWSTMFPLLSTCALWRKASLNILYSQCEFTPASNAPVMYTSTTNGSSLNDCLAYTGYVKMVTMDINYYEVVDGSLSSHLDTTARLANANYAHFNIQFDNTGLQSVGYQDRNIDQFTRLIDNIMPSIKYVTINVAAPPESGSGNSGIIMGHLLCRMLAGHKQANLSFACQYGPVRFSAPDTISNLTSLHGRWDANNEHFIQLLHTNSHSLTSLKIEFYHYQNMHLLLVDQTGQPICYPYVDTLGFQKMCESNMARPNLPDSMVPFPRLQFLEILIPYPFNDDVLFRGNQHSLKSFNILPDNHIANLLESSFLLPGRRLLQLHSFSYYDISETSLLDSQSLEIFEKFMLTSCITLRCLYVSCKPIAHGFVDLMAKCNYMQCLSRLTLNTYLTLVDVIKVVSKLPQLNSLASGISRLGDEFQGMVPETMLAKLAEEYGLLKVNFKKWVIINQDYIPYNSIFVVILLLASMFASFKQVMFVPKFSKQLEIQYRRIRQVVLYKRLQHRIKLQLDIQSIFPQINISQLQQEK